MQPDRSHQLALPTKQQAQAIIKRLETALANPGEIILGRGITVGSTDAATQLTDVRYGLAALDYFSGRLTESQSRETAHGLTLVLHARLGTLPTYIAFLEGTDIGETIDGPFDLVDRILRWLKLLGGIAGAPVTLPFDVLITVALAIYYGWISPPTPPCPVTTRDKWRHCYVACKISFWVPNGLPLAVGLALLKEVLDAMGLGTAEVEDFVESMRGISACGFFQSCEDCCCEKGY